MKTKNREMMLLKNHIIKFPRMEKQKLLPQNCPPNFPGQKSHQGINWNKEILKVSRESLWAIHKGPQVRMASNFLKATLEARRQESNVFKCLKGNYFHLRIQYLFKLSSVRLGWWRCLRLSRTQVICCMHPILGS